MTSSIPTSESASTNEVLVRVNGVSKKFCRDLKKSLWYGVKDVAAELFPFGKQKSEIRDRRSDSSASSSSPPSDSGLRPGEFWANKDISFELRRGQCLGLIGHNGAGKTTLLKMLNGLIKPDEGTIEMRGRVGALIALGAGFNPILSGRENVYVNGSILGLTKEEIDSKIEDIIDFADIRDFIDSPVQSYSSGMQVRLGFAVATALDPDILILDEVLAVGDAAFRNKCYNRIGQIQKNAAVIFVSHSMEQVARVCKFGMFLKKGRTIGLLGVEEAVTLYEADNSSCNSNEESFIKCSTTVNAVDFRIKQKEVEWNDKCLFELDLLLTQPLNEPFMRIFFFSSDGSLAGEWNTSSANIRHNFPEGNSRWKWEVGPIHLRPGEYKISFIVHERNSINQPIWCHKTQSIEIKGVFSSATTIQFPSSDLSPL
jgi:lipopolysaccharide transport system ATP-binding protein